MFESDVVEIGRRGAFSLAEAKKCVQLLRSITEKYATLVEAKMQRLESLETSNDSINLIEYEINQQIERWHSKVRKLGGEPKGLWVVDLDAGDGYFCWKHPEPELMYWHKYSEGFSSRSPLSQRPIYKPKETIVSTEL